MDEKYTARYSQYAGIDLGKTKRTFFCVKNLLSDKVVFVSGLINVYRIGSTTVVLEARGNSTSKGFVYTNVDVTVDSSQPFEDLEKKLLSFGLGKVEKDNC